MAKLRRTLLSVLTALTMSCSMLSLAACDSIPFLGDLLGMLGLVEDSSTDNDHSSSSVGGNSSSLGGGSSSVGGGEKPDEKPDDEDPAGSSSSTGNDEKAESIFDGDETNYVFVDNYVLSQNDVVATGGTGKVVVLDYVCTFDLGGNVLDLNGYTLQIVSEEEGCLIELEDGTIKNGILDISVPNGDITFDGVTLAEDADYELEAASSTIRFSNARISGKGKVKSESRVEIEYSAVQSITLEGNGTLNAGNGADLGSVEVSENASGASVNISSDATVSEMAISAAASVEIAGEVSSVKVNENVAAAEEVSVTVSSTAKVEKVELNAAAKVEVAGEVGNVTVSETAASSEKAVEVSVSSTAKVQKLDVQAKAEVKVEGEVSNVVVNEKASGTNVSVSGTSASVSSIVINSEDVKVESENAETVNKVIVAETVKEKVEVSENVTVETATKEEMEEHLKHEHVYTLTNTKLPTCEESGVATRACSCGDSYEQVIPATGHDYSITISKLPTETEEGVRTYTCRNDSKHTYTESIPALGVRLDSISELIGAWIGEGTYSIVLEEGSGVVVIRDYVERESEQDYKYIYTLELAEAVLDVEDGYPTGFMKLVLSQTVLRRDSDGDIEDAVASEDDAYTVAEIYAYLDGAYVYAEMNGNGQEMGSLIDSDMIFSEMFGLPADTLLEFIDLAKQAKAYAEMYRPTIEKFLETVAGMDMEADVNVEAILTLFEEYFLSVTEADNGDVAYELDLQKLSKDVLGLGKLTAKEWIDSVCGEGSFESLTKEAKDLPDLKLKEIADMAITLAENYGVEVDVVFGAIETLVYEIYDVELDIEAELENVPDQTLADVLRTQFPNYDDETGEVIYPTVEEIKAQYDQIYEVVIEYATTYTLDQLFNIYAYGDPNFIPNAEEGGEEVFSISAQLKAIVDMYNEATTITITVDKDGAFKSIVLCLEGLLSVEYADHAYTVEVNYNGYTVSVAGTVKADTDKVKVTIKNGEEVLYTGDVSLNIEAMTFEGLVKAVDEVLVQILADINKEDGDHSIDASVSVGGYDFDLEGSEEEGNISAVLKQGENEMFKAELQVTEGEGATVVISYAEVELVTIDAVGAAIENSQTTVTINVNGEEYVVYVTVAEIEEGVYEISLEMPEMAYIGDMVYDENATITVSVVETEEAYSCKVDVYMECVNEEETIVLVDGTLTFYANKNADGNVDSLTLEANVDRFLAGMGFMGSSSGETEKYYEGYASVNGSLTIELESELVIDKDMAEDIMDGFEIFQEMDFHSGNSYLTYVENENGGYYELCEYGWNQNSELTQNGTVYEGWVEYTAYSAIIPAINGVPALTQLYYDQDCGNWYFVGLTYEGQMEYQRVRVYGTFVLEDYDYKIVEQTSKEVYSSYPEYSPCYIYGYYNVVTKETTENSQHVYEYSATLLNGSVDCEDGIKVTETCANCDYESTWISYGCSQVRKQVQVLHTQCGDMTVYEYACVYCGMGEDSTNNNRHSWSHNRYQEEITADDLTALGLSVEGFYHGYVDEYHCSNCGMNRTEYTYYTHTQKEGCLRRYYTVYDYAGNEDYASASATVSSVNYGHYTQYEGMFSESLISKAEELIGSALTFTATSGSGHQYVCQVCGVVTETYIHLYGEGEDSISIYQYYNNKGEFSNLYYHLYDLDYVVEKAGEYALENATSGYIYVYLNEDKSERYFNLYMYDENNNRVYIYGGANYWRIEEYDYENCWVVETYVYSDGRTEVDEYEKHDYSWNYYLDGACCTEDGWYEKYACSVCGKDQNEEYDDDKYEDVYYSKNYYHRDGYGWYNGNLSDCKWITQNQGLGKATVIGDYCYFCDKMIDVTIVLQEDWTLENDVYMYAEHITIDFNGYTLDLNGYNFIVYGFNGSAVVLTNNEYDTSDPEANENSIVDSSEDESGYLVVFTEYGEIDVGTIAFDVYNFLSDSDNRGTIEDSFYYAWDETLDGYYELN